ATVHSWHRIFQSTTTNATKRGEGTVEAQGIPHSAQRTAYWQCNAFNRFVGDAFNV
ncbi:unnamed protein product, partial [Ceratitis capitata]